MGARKPDRCACRTATSHTVAKSAEMSDCNVDKS